MLSDEPLRSSIKQERPSLPRGQAGPELRNPRRDLPVSNSNARWIRSGTGLFAHKDLLMQRPPPQLGLQRQLAKATRLGPPMRPE